MYVNTVLALPEELNFIPELRSIEHDGKSLPTSIGQKIVRDDTNEVLGIVKSKYHPEPYSALWNPLVEGLEASDLDLSDAQVSWRVMNNGARMFADITLRNYDYDKIVGEPTALALRVYNSVDGSLAYNVSADPMKIGHVASSWPTALEKDAHLFNHMKGIYLERNDVQNFFTKHLCFTHMKSGMKVNESWLNKMMGLFDTYRSTIGNNCYALYNAITHFGTHVDQDRLRGAELGNRALRQEKSVQSLVRGLPFKNLIQYEEFEQLSGQVA